MILESIHLVSFKNFPETGLEFSGNLNCFTGNNGVGKTNILDAIFYLCMTKSYFNPVDSQNIRHGDDFFVIQGKYKLENQVEPDEVFCGFKRGQKKQFKRNKKEYDRLSSHIGLFPVVMISPADNSLIHEGSESRRRFMDTVISQYDREYLDDLIRYNHVLAQRNAQLKMGREGDEDLFAVWNDQMVYHGERIYAKRVLFVEKLVPVFQKYHEELSAGSEAVQLAYISQLHDQKLGELLQSTISRDKVLQYTTAGIHKDDLQMYLGDYPIKKVGSQGQQKTFQVALKLAEYEFISQVKGIKPMLLLDDIFDKFDESRVSRVVEIVSREDFGQIFITDTNTSRMEAILGQHGGENYLFRVDQNQVIRKLKE